LDQEMPGSNWMGAKLKAAVESGEVSQDKINDSVLRMLTPMYAFGIFDHAHQWTNKSAHGADVTSPAHSLIARQISAAASVLVKNNGILPFTKKVRSIALIGKDAENPTVHGGGSGQVQPMYVISPSNGIKRRFSNTTKMNCTFDPDVDYFVQPSSQHTHLIRKIAVLTVLIVEVASISLLFHLQHVGFTILLGKGEHTPDTHPGVVVLLLTTSLMLMDLMLERL